MASRSVFISYARTDGADVQDAVELLRAGGVKVFLDVVNIDFGQRWKPVLYKALNRCERVMVFWSQAAAASEWVEREWRYAIELGKKIVPTLLDLTPLPAELAEFQAVKRLRPAPVVRNPPAAGVGVDGDWATLSRVPDDLTRMPPPASPVPQSVREAPRRSMATMFAVAALVGALGAGGAYLFLAPRSSVPPSSSPVSAASAPQSTPIPAEPGSPASVPVPVKPLPVPAPLPAPPPVAMEEQLVSPAWAVLGGLVAVIGLVTWVVRTKRRRARPEAAAFVEQVFAA